MVSQATFALSFSALAVVSAALASESNGQTCSSQQEDDCIDVSLLQVGTSHYAMVNRESSLVDREAEAQMAFVEIRDQLRAHPKVAKQALHEALIEMHQSSNNWPFTTGANQMFSPQSRGAAKTAAPGMLTTNGKVKMTQVAAQAGEDQQSAGIAPPVEPADGNETTAAKPQKPTNGVQIAPFGKEDTARELTQHAVDTQDTLVDAVENAEVAEVKRAVFRSLTRLRAASIKEFDTIARLETQAFDEYNDAHHYRAENPLDYLHSSEPKVKEDKYTSFH